MANILYGVNGEGAGHSSRAREVLAHLESQGHAVHVVSFDRGLKNLSGDFDVTEVFGFRLSYLRNRVRYGRTVLGNLARAPRARQSVRKLQERAKEWKTDIVVTDFEPISCFVGHRTGLPVISIDNQNILVRAEILYPPQYRRDAAAAKLVTRVMTPRCDVYLVTSFFSARLKKKRTFLFPPILRKEILDARARIGDSVLVYVTSPSAELPALLARIRERFVCYGFGREGTDRNLTFRKPSLATFLEDLTSAKAVVANSGFSLVSEALYLGKPYLAWPVKRQFEQIFNAFYVDKMGYGAYWDDLNKERIESFLFNLDSYRENLRQYPRQDNSALFAKLDELILRFCGSPS
ncbi:MAG TPA: MJ1255/VC2487 family glycosyltransferase [Candidatus Acidoferrum sp.]|nr:MJ1255/VC2487 family glycosyltransferase [Candidatus Acidoferrum sp.]